MDYVCLSPCSVFLTARKNGRNGNCGIVSGNTREILVEVVEGGFPRIISRGYIIIYKVNIYYLKKSTCYPANYIGSMPLCKEISLQ